DCLARIFVDDPEHLCERPADSLHPNPTSQRFRYWVHEGYQEFLVGGDNGVADARERHCVASFTLPEFALRCMLVERHFDRSAQLGALERLEQITEWLSDTCPSKCHVVGICCQIDNRDPAAFTDLLCRIDAIGIALQPDVHQH